MIYGSAFGAVASTLVLLPVWQPIAAGDLALFVLVGLLGTAAQLCLIRAFSLAEASVVAPFGYIGILFAILWGIALFGEYPDGLDAPRCACDRAGRALCLAPRNPGRAARLTDGTGCKTDPSSSAPRCRTGSCAA